MSRWRYNVEHACGEPMVDRRLHWDDDRRWLVCDACDRSYLVLERTPTGELAWVSERDLKGLGR